MRVIVAGHSGIGKSRAIGRLLREFYDRDEKWPQLDENARKGREPAIARYFEADNIYAENGRPHDEKLLEDEWRTQAKEWGWHFSRRLEELLAQKPTHAFLGIHLSYHSSGRLSSPLSWFAPYCDPTRDVKTHYYETIFDQIINEFKPDCILTLTDDLAVVRQRIRKRYHFRLHDLIVWREVEQLLADLLASRLAPPNGVPLGPYPFHKSFLVSVRQRATSINRLLTEPKSLRVYASYPVTDTRAHADRRQEIGDFVDALHRDFVVFDPMTIDDRALHGLLENFLEGLVGSEEEKMLGRGEKMKRLLNKYDLSGKQSLSLETLKLMASDQWPVTAKDVLACSSRDDTLKIAADEIADVCRPGENLPSSLDQQIRTRDFRLIDQCDALVAYRPMWHRSDGSHRSSFSMGTLAEWTYANSTGKTRIVIHDPEEDGEYATGVWDTLKPANHYLHNIGNLSVKENRDQVFAKVRDLLLKDAEHNINLRNPGTQPWF